ncbi:MAG: hypothetical protein U1E50_15380 [Caulobacteraceae bacterium]
MSKPDAETHPAPRPHAPGAATHAEKAAKQAPLEDHEKRKLAEEAARGEDA